MTALTDGPELQQGQTHRKRSVWDHRQNVEGKEFILFMAGILKSRDHEEQMF